MQQATACDKRYKYTLLTSFNGQPKTDVKGHGKYSKACQKVRQRRLYATPQASPSWNCYSWHNWIYNSVCLYSNYFRILITLSQEKSHFFAVRTTGGQEKVVMGLLENRIKLKKINIQSVLLLDNLKGYVVVEAIDVNAAFDAMQGIRHIRGQLRGELQFKDIEGYLVKKSTVSELAVDKIVEIIGGPFKGMKATITRVDHDKEEATVILLDAPYQLPVTVDANYLKLSTS